MSYYGYSMSWNAKKAYDYGEKPLSKWTKADIIGVVEYEFENEPDKVELVKQLPLAVLKDKILTYSGWHHTSKYYNETYFYDVDLDVVDALTQEEINSWLTAYAKEKAEKYEAKKQQKKNNKYIATIRYVEWGGTRNYPKAYPKELKDVLIEERGCFYIVYDRNESGKVILRKKIGSNGTEVEKISDVKM